MIQKRSRVRGITLPPKIHFIDDRAKSDRVITKYFDPMYLDDIKNGRFRFGTNRVYRRGLECVSASGVLDDEMEGDLIFDFNCLPSYVEDFSTPIFKAKKSITPSINVKFVWYINDHTFCATYGEYDLHHHIAMVSGVREENFEYRGNSSYTAFCEIDFKKFLRGTMRQAKLKRNRRMIDRRLPAALAGRVHYDSAFKAVTYHGFLPKNYNYKSDSYAHYVRAAFSKDIRFSVEREIRVVTPLFDIGRTPLDAGAEFYQSSLLKESVVRIGFL